MLPLDEITAYSIRTEQERHDERRVAAARAEAAADHAAALIIAETALTARHVWPLARSLTIDIDTDTDRASLHQVTDAQAQPLWHADTCDCAGFPNSTAPRHKTARAVENYVMAAREYSPAIGIETDGPDDDTRRYEIALPIIPRAIPVTPTPHAHEPNRWDSAAVITMHCRYTRRTERLALHYIGPGGTSRREYGGPQLPGPHAGFFPLADVIDNYGGTGAQSARARAAGQEFDAQPGDLLLIDGHLFEIRDDEPATGYPRPHLIK
ncbi:hypothetical protein [Catenuloplanes atrovinosus]|uniref:Uncharacterized protein n=1 Tax=Catenuloplanes atrovinosus TaxID=137266 RepID=A0AAE3YSN9_9ACTN|nr:hypothetical protein [Catenuloplanes atrovinosus]MDR7277644.1 hypothetical protein [Catenuloplanes atrovinosus]